MSTYIVTVKETVFYRIEIGGCSVLRAEKEALRILKEETPPLPYKTEDAKVIRIERIK